MPQSSLERLLGLKEATAIVINRIIGSGIFRTPAPIFAMVGSVALFYEVWIIGAVATLFAAFCYAELVAMLPRSGGPYEYLKEAYGPKVAYLRGWAMFFVSETGAIAAVAIFFSETLSSVLFQTVNPFSVIMLSVAVVWLLSYVNSRGVKLSGALQNIFSLVKVAVLLLVLIACFSDGFMPGSFQYEAEDKGVWGTILAIGAAMRYTFFAYSGWEGATYVAEEVKNPGKNLPASLFIGIGVVLLLYLLVNTGYLNILGAAGVEGADVVAVDALVAALGVAGGAAVGMVIMASTFTNLNSQLFVKSRTWFAMARDGLFFRRLAEVHPRFHTPNKALYAQAFWASVLILFAGFAESAYEMVIDFFSFTSSIFNVLTLLALYVLRKKMPAMPRPYRAWGYPYTLIIVVAIYVAFMIITLITAFWPSMMGIVLTLSGLLFYHRFKGNDLA
ncbi:APC family permease [Roseivirga sp. BDSF3-8]|uniref:APC family permease n=1 Tax=Roseivirga sp. BDSF3-8 TaxID=3241598 RepID=UPI003531F5E6